jgi:membrane-associated phospholipid phosphatase
MKNFFCFIASIIFCGNAFCNDTDTTKKTNLYHINYPVIGIEIAAGTVSDLIAIIRIKNKPKISADELIFLNSKEQRDLISQIDRWSLRQKLTNRKFYKLISDYGMAPVILLPAFLVINKNIRKDWIDLLLMYTEGHTVTYTFYNYSFLGPTFQNRYRPITYYSEFTDEERMTGNNRNSFYSGHVATCAYSTFFMTKIYCDYHPNYGASKYLWYLAAAIPPALMGYARIRALDHFPSDDAVGLMLGAALGIIIPELHKHRYYKNLSLAMSTSPDDLGLSICWNFQHHHALNYMKANTKDKSNLKMYE